MDHRPPFGLLVLATTILLALGATALADSHEPATLVPVAGGHELYSFQRGVGTPAVVVLNSVFIEEELAPLATSRAMLFVHARGQGGSSFIEDLGDFGLEQELADILAVLDFHGLEQVDLIATSLWGAIAALFAAEHPERVRSLIMLNPVPPTASLFNQPGRTPSNDNRDARQAVATARSAGLDESDPAAFCRLRLKVTNVNFVVDPSNLDRRLTDPCQWRNNHEDIAQPRVDAIFDSLGVWNWTGAAENIAARTLVVYGSNDLAAAAAFRAWASAAQDARYLEVPSAGHETLLDQPELALAAIESVLGGAWPEGSVAP